MEYQTTNRNAGRSETFTNRLTCNNWLWYYIQLFSIEKCTALKKLIRNKKLSLLARLFLEDTEWHDIHTAEKKMLVLLHNGQSSDTLDELTHHVFCKKIAVGSSCTQAESLPPTSAAARYHSEGVYCQVQQWMGKSSLRASKWEWRIENSLCLPKMTAPEDLLNVICCTCKEILWY